ncbi:MAG: hypothetical protein JSC085_000729 [Candidatus Tokpelaia sp. JSC085]|nr:MAG: hypothetical protein JSC085_000729 [Candidatus Tokpelaia sp. JSC085]
MASCMLRMRLESGPGMSRAEAQDRIPLELSY